MVREKKSMFKALASRAKKPFKLSKYYCKTILYSYCTNVKFQYKRNFKRCKCRIRILVYEKSLLKPNFSTKKFKKLKETIYFAILKKTNTKIAKKYKILGKKLREQKIKK